VSTSADDGLDPGHELTRGEGLGHVVVGTEFEAEHPVDLVVARREHDDRQVGPGPHPAAHLEPVDRAGQTEIEDQQAGVAVLDDPERGLTVGRLVHPVPLAAQVQLDQIGDVGVVLDDGNHWAVGGHGGSIVAPRPRGRRARCLQSYRSHVMDP
jgi:hypothetical protein